MKPLVITYHAADRYRERVKPGLDRSGAKAELEALCAMHPPIVAECPMVDHYEDGPGDCYAEIAPGIWLGLKEENGKWIALTCLTNASVGERTRRARKIARAEARRYKRWRKGRRGRAAYEGG